MHATREDRARRFGDWDAIPDPGWLCPSCRYKHPNAPSCAAYPGGVPTGILAGRIDHTKPVEGDHGITYQPDAGA